MKSPYRSLYFIIKKIDHKAVCYPQWEIYRGGLAGLN